MFYLVQRLTVAHTPSKRGLDRHFQMDYMGSSEFEWGALPASLREIRACEEPYVITEGQAHRRGQSATVYVVAPATRASEIVAAMNTWLLDDFVNSQEATRFPEQVDGTADDYGRRTVAWWSLEGTSSDFMFTLDLAHAETLLGAISEGASWATRV